MFTKVHRSFTAFFVLVTILGMLAIKPIQPVLASTLIIMNTNDSGAGSLRQAIVNAGPGDTITFHSSLSGQTITLESTLVIDKNLTIDGSTLSSPINVSGNNSVRVFEVPAGISAALNDITIRSGYHDNSGGGIDNSGTLTLTNAYLLQNAAESAGGAIFNRNTGTLNIFYSRLAVNSAYQGGGIYNAGTMTLTDSTLEENSASYRGAGIYNTEILTVTNSTLLWNEGGGIFNTDRLTVINSNISENLFDYGIYSFDGTSTVTNSTVSWNDDGGILIQQGTLAVTNSTIASNLGGFYGVVNAGNAELYITNSILYDNSAGEIYSPGSTPVVRYSIVQGGYVGTGNLNVDPLLGPLADNGGFTQTMALSSGSPAIDAAYDASCPDTDQRGVIRPQGSHCDIGAYEYEYRSLIVTKTADTDDGVCDDDCSLREAMGVAPQGGMITFANSLSGQTITLLSPLDIITRDLTIDGSALASKIQISGNNSVPVIGSSLAEVTLKDLVIINGNAQGDRGGGIGVYGGSMNLINSIISGNSASEGGGIYNTGILTITNSTISSNQADYGGGIENAGRLDINNSVLADNSSGFGGGILIDFGDDNSTETVNITESTLSNNWAAYSGGGISATNGVLHINNSTFSDNTSSEGGGGIYMNVVGALTVNNSSFSGNKSAIGGAIFNNANMAVENSTFLNNSASAVGGAIACYTGTMTVTNSMYFANRALSESGGSGGAIYDHCNSTIAKSTFAANTAAQYGGAILTDNDIEAVEVTNSTFYGNTSPTGGGIASYGRLIVINSTFSDNSSPNGGAIRNGLGGVLSLRNSILANSIGGVDCTKSDGSPEVENINNLIETTGSETEFESCGVSLLSSEPLLGPLADNGGFTETMALLSGSPAIDAAYDAACPDTDQRGVIRPQGAHCDIGAYEVYEVSPTFTDVPSDYWAWRFIEGLYNAGVTSGCSTSPMLYCPTTTVTRDQMAIFLLRAKHGSNYTPPVATGVFQDVPTNHWAASWIEQLAAEGITGGCSTTPKLYCPTTPVTRDQMAVFLLRAEHGSSYSPPAPTGTFQDVPTNHWAASWIERLAAEGITGGCSTSPMQYCPITPVSRDQMAVFLVRTFGLAIP